MVTSLSSRLWTYAFASGVSAVTGAGAGGRCMYQMPAATSRASTTAMPMVTRLSPTDGHLPDDQHRRSRGTPELQCTPNLRDTVQHLGKLPRDGDLRHRIRELPALDPQPGRAARIVAGHCVHTGSDELRH